MEKFPYIEAADYTDPESIFEAFPQLRKINEKYDWNQNKNIEGLVIRSANDDNVHKVIFPSLSLSNMVSGQPLRKTGKN